MNIGLVKYLKLHGYTQIYYDDKINDVNNIMAKININNIRNIFIVGLDGGFIADYFLTKNNNTKITIFDNEPRVYNHISEEYLYITYNERVDIRYSNILKYSNDYLGPKYDLIFINSDRSQKKNIDYINLTKNLSHKDTKILMTNTKNIEHYNGAHKCWKKMVTDCKIKEINSITKNKKNGLNISLGVFV